jgi:hypothetical protein
MILLFHDAQPQVSDERLKVSVVVQQVVPTRDAPGGNYHSDRLANGYPDWAMAAPLK